MFSNDAFFRHLSFCARDAIVAIDGAGKIVFWNPAAESIFEYSPEEALGRLAHELLTRSHATSPTQSAELSRFRTTGDGSVVGKILELQAVSKNKRVFPIELAVSSFQFEERWYAVAVIRDISERKTAEKAILHSSKLASVGTLAAGVAHEINNPLVILRGYLSMLKDKIKAGEDASELLKLLEKQDRAVDRMARIVRGLQGYARPDMDSIERIDLNGVVQESFGLFEHIFKNEGIAITSKLESKKPVFVGNAGKMQQVLVNLVVNARDALESTAQPKQINIETQYENGVVQLTVTDNGCGISEEHLSSLFVPFFTTKPPGKGTGLGLSISRSIVESFGGRIEVQSHVGKGSSFKVILPSAKEEQQ